ncbi:MAG TPA: Hsp20/alpha crystallin family protein [Blastocatellia bacterium]|nr:Hsp20/alpha crystallin family protein [Blastocatellia bacterium]
MAFGSGTAVKRIDPFQELMGIQDRMNQLFRSTYSGFGDDNLTSGAWSPVVDIYETPEAIEMTFELPGVNQKDIHINIENNLLSVSGERKLEHEDMREGYHRVERNYGGFVRSFTVPSTIDPNGINAVFENGLLRLTLTKRPETKPRAIEVKTR